MRSVRIYQSGAYHVGDHLSLGPSQAHHVASVLRMQPGESITLFNGLNQEFEATILSARKKDVCVEIQTARDVNRESPRGIHLAQAISKGERMEWVIQKAVELGVSLITPLISARTVVKLDEERLEKKQQQWQAIAISACEQSGRNTVPQIASPIKLAPFLSSVFAPYRFTLDPKSEIPLKSCTFAPGEIVLLVGPEGGLNHDEITLAKTHGFHGVSLGPRILRTETAAVCALSLLQALAGDL